VTIYCKENRRIYNLFTVKCTLNKTQAVTDSGHSDTDSPNRFFAVEEWEASVKVDLHQDTELPYPPPLVTRYHERGKSQGRARISRISATDHAVIWNGPGEVSCSYAHSALAVRPAFTVSSITEGQANLPAEVSLQIYPESGEYAVVLRIDGPLPVVERAWAERHPEIDRVASMVQSAKDPLEVLAGLPMLLAQALIPEATVQEREISPADGSSQRRKLPATGMVLSGRHQSGAITLGWSLRPAHEEKMRIYRIVDGLWEDVTAASSDVLSGQRVELEGRSIRMSEVIGFEWELEGLDEEKAIDDWRVEGNMPQIIPIADTQSSELNFAYWDGHQSPPMPIGYALARAWHGNGLPAKGTICSMGFIPILRNGRMIVNTPMTPRQRL
jgi:hypothetical protein